jgi:glycosyltransferase involved in cell wall biosynthesis
MSPLFTIATITYNSSAWVKQTIESVLSSTYTDFEYIISDDCSSDNTWDVIQSYDDNRIKSFRSKNNLGEYNNRNFVLQQATGKYIFYIDGDDILYRHTLQNLHVYLQYFKEVGMIWGVPAGQVDFAVLPYKFNPEQVISLTYFTHLPLSILGLGETIFNVAQLRAIGGFNTEYAIGDTYVKRKLSLTSSVLFVPEGLSFWRRSANQASARAGRNLRSFVDMCSINNHVLDDHDLPLNSSAAQVARENIRISQVKLLVANTLSKGKVSQFFKLRKQLSLSFSDLIFLFKKGKYNYKPIADISQPLINDFHFSKHAEEIAVSI